ncbi:MAG: hypothetical protein KAH77_10920 [Thiomargarita sp.]|nr:hypothetical protein [Thiomargarita sp.]
MGFKIDRNVSVTDKIYKSVSHATDNISKSVNHTKDKMYISVFGVKRFYTVKFINWVRATSAIIVLLFFIGVGALLFAGNTIMEWASHNTKDALLYAFFVLLFVGTAVFVFYYLKVSILIASFCCATYVAYAYYIPVEFKESIQTVIDNTTATENSDSTQNVTEKGNAIITTQTEIKKDKSTPIATENEENTQ